MKEKDYINQLLEEDELEKKKVWYGAGLLLGLRDCPYCSLLLYVSVVGVVVWLFVFNV